MYENLAVNEFLEVRGGFFETHLWIVVNERLCKDPQRRAHARSDERCIQIIRWLNRHQPVMPGASVELGFDVSPTSGSSVESGIRAVQEFLSLNVRGTAEFYTLPLHDALPI